MMIATVGALPEGSRRRRFRALLAVGLVALLVLVALAVRSDLQVRHDTRTAHARASRLASERRVVVADIDRRRQELTTAEQQLDEGRRTLGLLVAERDVLRKALAASRHSLDGARRSVARARQEIVTRSGRITALGQCLNGVGSALNALAVGDDGSALGSLQLVAAACQQSDQLAAAR